MGRKKAINPVNAVIQIKVTPELKEAFEAKAIENRTNISDLGRQLIEVYLE